jgi:trimeric autotransporter adhesin
MMCGGPVSEARSLKAFRFASFLAATLMWLSLAPAEAAFLPRLVKDLSTNSAGSQLGPFVVWNGVAYFRAFDPTHGSELWRSDGTEAGTWLVIDLLPGAEGSSPSSIIVWSNQLWFAATTGTNDVALMRSDGTSNGTFVVKSGFPDHADTVFGYLTAVGNQLFFYGYDDEHHRELWKSDGTEAGTVLVKDINPGPVESLPIFITDVNGTAVFRANDGTNGVEIWASDGTEAGTVMLRDIEPGASSSYPDSFTMLGTNLFFAARNGTELWKTDGTSNGTALVATFSSAGFNSSIEYLTVVGTQLFFRATSSGDSELWRSDGTSNGTVRVKDIFSGGSSFPGYIADANGTAIFSADDGSVRELWRSDGTSSGTWRVKGTNGLTILGPYGMSRVNDSVYFRVNDSTNGTELWRTDGTSNSAVLIKDIWPGPSSSNPSVLADMGGFAFIAAATAEYGSELWRTDGTEAGTTFIKDINSRTGNTTLQTMGVVGDTFFFTVSSSELWKTEGTAATTERLYAFPAPVPSGSFLSPAMTLAGSLFFSAIDTNGSGQELWVSDGTANGTRMLKDIQPGAGSSSPWQFTRVGTNLYFVASGTNGNEIWKTDGTGAGTMEASDVYSGGNSSYPRGLIEYGGALFFHASHTNSRSGLFRIDSTQTGAVRLVEFTNETFYGIQRAAGQLFLFMSAGTNTVLWTSHGTPETTTLLGSVPIRSALSTKKFATAGRSDALLFTAGDNSAGFELWRSDGTLAGTYLVKDIYSDMYSSSLGPFFVADDIAYFAADDGVHGREIWRSDGTPAGTRLLKDIAPGVDRSASLYGNERMAAVNGLVFFWADESTHGTEVWMSDGTEMGTMLAHDLNPSTQIFYNYNGTGVFDSAGNRFYFIGDNGVTGRELWVIDVPPRPTLAAAIQQEQLVIESAGAAGQTRVLEQSSDLTTWTPFATNVAGADGFTRTTNGVPPGNRFFRARGVIGTP